MCLPLFFMSTSRTARTLVIASTVIRASGVRPTGTNAGPRRVSTADCVWTALPSTIVRVPTAMRVRTRASNFTITL